MLDESTSDRPADLSTAELIDETTGTPAGGEAANPLVTAVRWLIPVALIALWEFAVQDVSSILIPPPSAIASAIGELATSGQLFDLLWTSNQSLVLGTLLSLMLGIPFGILLGQSKTVDGFLGIFISISLSSPTVAFLPFVIVIFGLGLQARVFVVFLFSFDLVVSIIRNGVKGVDPTHIEMARAFNARWYHVWPKVILPGMMPSIAAALRIAITRGIVGVVIVEFTLIAVGIGGFITLQRAYFRSDMVFAGVLIICVEAVLLTIGAQKLEKKLAPKGLYGTG